ncbi:PREDICTED: protein toll-like, partial [Polistes canadensis]|uniref:protein toll-like n=1 Tax=Polistes canadensis TaxID=91411 RepID=UPI000718B8AD
DFFLNFPQLEWLDLSRNKLVISTDNFDEIPNLKRLELIGNDIKTITAGTFDKLSNLEFLNLMGNKLTEIDGLFEELMSLKSLSLDMNNLFKLQRSTFHQLKKLETLDISMNNFFYIPSKLLNQNKELRRLLLHHNIGELDHLPVSFLSNFEELKEVILNNNGFKKLPENLFRGSISLQYINLNCNYLKTLPQNIFTGLRNVETLLLRNNAIEDLPTDIFKDFEKLRKLDLSMNLMTSIKKNLLENLLSLIELNMERNRLTVIEPMAFFPLTNIFIVKLSHNQLELNSTSTKWSPFYNNSFLSELHLSNNSIETFFSDWSISRYHLKLLDLSYNQINTISGNNFILPSDRILVDLRYNNISNIFLHDIEELAIYQSKERDVVILVDHNPILCDCYLYDLLLYLNNKMPRTVYNYFKIKLGNLSCVQYNGTKGPQITKLDLNTYTCPEDKFFSIRRNCQVGCTCAVRLHDTTRILDCSYKNMSEFLIDRTQFIPIRTYPLILNLTGNFLTEVPSIQALISINVTGLLLSNNRISQVTINKLPENLTSLELHNNNISEIDSEVLGFVYSRSLKVFTLSGNPIKCNCGTRSLHLFVQSKRSIYKDLNNVKCDNTNTLLYKMTHDQLCQNSSLDKEVELNERETHGGVKILRQ